METILANVFIINSPQQSTTGHEPLPREEYAIISTLGRRIGDRSYERQTENAAAHFLVHGGGLDGLPQTLVDFYDTQKCKGLVLFYSAGHHTARHFNNTED